MSPCRERHALERVPACSECNKLLVLETEISQLPKDLITAAYRGGFIERIRVHDKTYYFREQLRKLEQQDEKTKRKLLQKVATPPKQSPSQTSPSPSKILSPLKVSTPIQFRIPTPKKIEPDGIKTPNKIQSKLKVESPGTLRPSKIQKVSEHAKIPVPSLPVAEGTQSSAISFSVPVTPPPITAIPSPTPSVTLSIASSSILSSGQLPSYSKCAECGSSGAKRRQCTGNHLCTQCRQLPHHKLVSDQVLFRVFRNLRYADIDRGVQSGIVRKLNPSVYIEHNQSFSTNYFYEQDILKIV